MKPQSNITHIVMHYSATYGDQDIGASDIDKWHRDRGFAQIGYHWVIRRNGTVEAGRSEGTVGAHVRGHNTGTIGICVVGGLDRATGPNRGVDNRTPLQIAAQIKLTREVLSRHPGARVVGHLDLAATQCPAYDAAAWWASVSAPVVVQESAQSERQNGLTDLLAFIVAWFKGRG